MSHNLMSYKIHYDNNFGSTDTETIYCICNNTSDTQEWIDENCNPIILSGTDSRINILALCMLQQPSQSKYYGWEVSKEDCPNKVFEYYKNT